MSYQCMDFETKLRIKNTVFEKYKKMSLTDREAEVMSKYDSKLGLEYDAPEHLKMSLEEYVDQWNSATSKLKAMGDKRGFYKRTIVNGDVYKVPPEEEDLYFPDNLR